MIGSRTLASWMAAYAAMTCMSWEDFKPKQL